MPLNTEDGSLPSTLGPPESRGKGGCCFDVIDYGKGGGQVLGRVQVSWENSQIPDGSSERPLSWNHCGTGDEGAPLLMGAEVRLLGCGPPGPRGLLLWPLEVGVVSWSLVLRPGTIHGTLAGLGLPARTVCGRLAAGVAWGARTFHIWAGIWVGAATLHPAVGPPPTGMPLLALPHQCPYRLLRAVGPWASHTAMVCRGRVVRAADWASAQGLRLTLLHCLVLSHLMEPLPPWVVSQLGKAGG